MQQKLLRASLMLTWTGSERFAIPNPEDVFPGKGTLQMGPEGPILRGEVAESGRFDEILFGTNSLRIACDLPGRVSEACRKLEPILAQIKISTVVYGAEYEWITAALTSQQWITERFIVPQYHPKEDGGPYFSICNDLTFYYGDGTKLEAPFYVLNLQPRVNTRAGIYGNLSKHSQEINEIQTKFADCFDNFVAVESQDVIRHFLGTDQ